MKSLTGQHININILESVGELCDFFFKLKHLINRTTLVDTRVVKLLLIVIVIVMKHLWRNSNSNSNRLRKIQK